MRRFAAAIGIVLVAVSAAGADGSRLEPLEKWLAMVRTHEPGVLDGPLLTLAGRSSQEITSLWLLAQTFLGGEEEALGHVDEARAAFTRAGDFFPLAQSPAIALSHLAREADDRTAALSGIQRLLDLPTGELNRRDPYWGYHTFPGWQIETRLDDLYRPFRRSPP